MMKVFHDNDIDAEEAPYDMTEDNREYEAQGEYAEDREYEWRSRI